MCDPIFMENATPLFSLQLLPPALSLRKIIHVNIKCSFIWIRTEHSLQNRDFTLIPNKSTNSLVYINKFVAIEKYPKINTHIHVRVQLLTKYEQPMECLMSAHKVTVKTEKVHVKDFI